MHLLTKSKQKSRKLRKNKSRKTIGGASPTARSVQKENEKLQSIKAPAVEQGLTRCTPGVLSSTMPPAIAAAKKAITYALENPENSHAYKMAEIKIQIADYWTDICKTRKNWRNEKNTTPNRNVRDWYETGQHIIWKLNPINEYAKRKMNTILPYVKEHVALLPVEDSLSEMGKEYRATKKRFERRAQGLSSVSPSSEKK